jgi:plastocyanin
MTGLVAVVRRAASLSVRTQATRATLFTAAALLTATLAISARAATTHTVVIDGTAFAPATVTVQQGDRVVWQNKDPFPHTATSRDGGFDSKSIAPGKSFTFVAANKGTFDYVCSFHPNMKGTLVVQ